MSCQNCGAELPIPSKFCPACGRPITGGGDLTTSQSEPRTKVRVGGWLILFCVLLTIIFPLGSCSGMAEHTDLAIKHGVDTKSPIYSAIGQNALGGAIAGMYAFIAGLRIWLGSPKGRKIAITFLCVYPIIMLLFNIIAFDMLSGEQGAGLVRVELLKSTIGPFIFSLIWLAYFKWSKRVKTTYSHPVDIQ